MIEIAAVVLLGAVLLLQIVALVRSKDSSVPVGVMVELDRLNQSSRELQLSVNKLEGGLGAVTAQVQGVAQAAAGSLEPLRGAIDKQLALATAESRAGRGDVAAAFQNFETKFEQRLATVAAESRSGSGELVAAFQGFEARLEQRLATFDATLATGRMELADALAGLRGELTKAVGYIAVESTKSRDALMENAASFEKRIQERFEALTTANQQVLESLKSDIGTQLTSMSTALRDQLEGNGSQVRNQLSIIQESVAQQLAGMAQGNQQNAEHLRGVLNERLSVIQADNTVKLDEIRRTVDEKLHATLEQRLGQSFQLVSDRLEQVHRGLGEMQALTAGVGDLKRVLANVKTRGTWGEVQLGAIIEQVLTPEQFGRNVATKPKSSDCVEFALKLPGKQGDQPVWLPIDAKFPMEDYQRLLDAYERADEDGIKTSALAIEDRIKTAACAIRDRYVSPPHTTDFAILYLPAEGLFAEVLRRPGLSEAIQREYRVVISGPTTLAAMLNSLQMGFKTLTIEKRSTEVWSLLGAVKTEFGKFGDVLVATQQKLEAATNQFSEVNIRTRAIQRRLRNVEELPPSGLGVALPMFEPQAALEEGLDS